MLDDLVGVIETLKGRIATHGASLRENETRARMALIDPLLQALGWDTSDPALVTPEYNVGASRADYALLTSTGNPSALVEAKKLDESLASHRMQMLNYANISGIPYAGLTDGNHWEMYTVFNQAPIEKRRILDVSIANTPAHEAALKLLLIWRPNLESGHPVAASAPVLVSPTKPVFELTPPTPDSAPTVVSIPPTAVALGVWTSLSQIGDGEARGQKPPKAVKFNDGESPTIRAWWQVLAEVASFLSRHGYLTIAHCPIGTGRGFQFINSVPRSPRGRDFAQPKRISGGLYLDAKMSSHMVIRHSKRLLAHFQVNPETVELRFE